VLGVSFFTTVTELGEICVAINQSYQSRFSAFLDFLILVNLICCETVLEDIEPLIQSVHLPSKAFFKVKKIENPIPGLPHEFWKLRRAITIIMGYLNLDN